MMPNTQKEVKKQALPSFNIQYQKDNFFAYSSFLNSFVCFIMSKFKTLRPDVTSHPLPDPTTSSPGSCPYKTEKESE